MSLRDLPSPRFPGISINVDLPRWLPRAIRLGLVLTVVFILGVGVLVSRFGGPSDHAWSSHALYVDAIHRADTGVWEFDVLVVAGTDGGALHDGWSVVLSNGGVIPAIGQSAGRLKPGEKAEIRVTAIYAYNGQPSPGDPVSLRWDPNGRLGTYRLLNDLDFPRQALSLSP